MREETTGSLAAERTLRRVKIASLGTFVPPRVLTNADLEKMIDTTDEWILKRTGVRERHIADSGVASSDLGTEASLAAIAIAAPPLAAVLTRALGSLSVRRARRAT